MNIKNSISEFSPMKYARIGGVLYLIIIIAGLFGQLMVREALVVSGDPTATANKIMNSEMLWRIGISVDLIMQICDLPLMLIFYLLLKPVNKNLALLTLLFNLIQTAVLVANKLNLLMALFLLGDATYLNNFNPDQLHTLSYIYIKLHDAGFGVGLIFFGFVCLIEGYLIFKSKYFPKAIGILMQIAGLCYLINCFTLLLAPKFLSNLVLVPCLIGELSLCLWLIFKGVNITEWNKLVGVK
ncbi:DUF4386 domain-containing protein [Flavobacterium sp.]|uniref:DUF4386 domain-containing protein n=1 Tax=Flavobacterium sp. TaxID=239 RepID=UPI00286E690F|nr:DUF4386 domain-containing protein [Flavobacterium sp.]